MGAHHGALGWQCPVSAVVVHFPFLLLCGIMATSTNSIKQYIGNAILCGTGIVPVSGHQGEF
jgi:hypothetical protein